MPSHTRHTPSPSTSSVSEHTNRRGLSGLHAIAAAALVSTLALNPNDALALALGRVTVQSQHPTEPDEVEYRPMADLPVSVSGVGFLRDVRTDESGRYEVTNVPVGPVDIEVGTSLPRSPETGDWRILDPRGCVAADFVLSPVAPGDRRDVGTLRLKTPEP